jgi:Uma2 family endonuclease
MSMGNVRLPDVVYISFEDMPQGRLTTEPIPTLPPTLAVEVLSVTNTLKEIRRKLVEYFQSGTRLAWIIHPKSRCIEVFTTAQTPAATLELNDTLDGGNVLPGFSLAVAEVFAGVPQAE